VVGRRQKRVLEIEEVGRDVEGEDLARPVAGDLVAAGEAGEEEGAMIRPFTFAKEMGARGVRAELVRQGEDLVPVGLRQRGAPAEPANQVRKWRTHSCRLPL
jgi:hypothetical protein